MVKRVTNNYLLNFNNETRVCDYLFKNGVYVSVFKYSHTANKRMSRKKSLRR